MSAVREAAAEAVLNSLGLTVAAARLDTIAQVAAAGNWSYSHFAGVLLETELAERKRKRVALNLQFANFPAIKRLEDFDYTAQPSHDRRLVEELATGRYLAEGRNVMFLGPPGVGKTHIAIALGLLTCLGDEALARRHRLGVDHAAARLAIGRLDQLAIHGRAVDVRL